MKYISHLSHTLKVNPRHNNDTHPSNIDIKVDFKVCPVGGHNYNDKVERRICRVRCSLEKLYNGQRLSLMQWKTVSSEISNRINDLPLTIGDCTSNLEAINLITQNRLKLGRSNERSSVGPCKMTNNTSRRYYRQTPSSFCRGLTTG